MSIRVKPYGSGGRVVEVDSFAEVEQQIHVGLLCGEDYVSVDDGRTWVQAGECDPLVDACNAVQSDLANRRDKNADVDNGQSFAPLLDVLMLLVSFFIVHLAAGNVSLEQELALPAVVNEEIVPPEETHGRGSLREEYIVLTIAPPDRVHIEQDEVPASVDAIARALQEAMSRTGKTRLLVAADDRSTAQATVAVLDAANSAQPSEIAFSDARDVEAMLWEQDGHGK